MARQTSSPSRPILLDFDPDTAFEKSVVRLAQASRAGPDSFLALRAGAVLLQVAGVSTIAMSLLGGFLLATADIRDELGFPPAYLAVGLVLAGAAMALLLLVTSELLTLQLTAARSTRLVSVLLAEMNFAERAKDVEERDRSRMAASSSSRPLRRQAPAPAGPHGAEASGV